MSHYHKLQCFCGVSHYVIFGCPIHYPTDFLYEASNESYSERELLLSGISKSQGGRTGASADDVFYETFVARPLHLRDGGQQEGQIYQPCLSPDCILMRHHDGPHALDNGYSSSCKDESCCLWEDHPGEHEPILICDFAGCNRPKGHLISHDSRAVASTLAAATVKIRVQRSFNPFHQSILEWMTLEIQFEVSHPAHSHVEPSPQSMRETSPIGIIKSENISGSGLSESYPRIQPRTKQIRLFKILPSKSGSLFKGSFSTYELSECPDYIALSYMWGDETTKHHVPLSNGGTIAVRDNLWQFLQLQGTRLTEPTYFWIDAICINQENVHERNHQVRMMKEIYTQATEVYVWLGPEADDSDLVMEFLTRQSTKPLRAKGPGYLPLWDRRTAKALSDLCDRPYWRRMWIIQELLHARKITILCGTSRSNWSDLEALYLKLETIQNTHWFAHHDFHIQVKQSAAATMIWQRAHWRHPDTPAPRLSRLIEIFRDWQCTHLRDKVFALVGMASPESAIIPDYTMTPQDVYHAVMSKVEKDNDEFASLLSQLLGVSGEDVDLYDQALYAKCR